MMNEENYLLAYFGPQAEYYLQKHKAFHSGKKFTFNVSALLAGLFWFLYRKLYAQAAMLFVLYNVFVYLTTLLNDFVIMDVKIRDTIKFLPIVILPVICGFVGNNLYVKKSDKQIRMLLSQTENEEERIELLKATGGIAWTPILLLILAHFLLALVITEGFKNL